MKAKNALAGEETRTYRKKNRTYAFFLRQVRFFCAVISPPT